MSVAGRKVATSTYRIEQFTARYQAQQALRTAVFEADAREISAAALKAGEIMPPISDKAAYRKIVADGLKLGLIHRPDTGPAQDTEGPMEGDGDASGGQGEEGPPPPPPKKAISGGVREELRRTTKILYEDQF